MADLFDSKENLFVKVAKFEELFPQLEDAVIEWTDGKYEHKASLKQYGEVIRCSNPECRQGGFELHPQVREMVDKKQATSSGSAACKGSLSKSRLKAQGEPCPKAISYKMTLVYKQ